MDRFVYRLELTQEEIRLLRGALAHRLAALGILGDHDPQSTEEIALLTRLIPRLSTSGLPGQSYPIELSSVELSAADRHTSRPLRFRGYTSMHPRAMPAMQSIRRKIGQQARPTCGPWAMLRHLLSV
jgi:hypothetical protein